MTGLQLRYDTGLTGEEYVKAEAWRDARLERCPNHPHGGCSVASHGTYGRKTPPGAKVPRWYCPQSHTTISMLADCLHGIARAAGARFEALDIAVIDVPALRLDHPDDRRRLQQTVERIAPRLLILDPLVRLHGVDENAVADVAPNLRLLDAFLTGLRDAGYAAATIRLFRQGCTGLIVWLHLSRIRLCELTSEVYARFENRQFVCSIPGVLCGRGRARCGTAYEAQLRGFLKHLVVIGRIAPLEPAPVEQMPPDRLERFALWLEHHRGIGEGSIRRHVRLIAGMMPELGDDPGIYDVALIRRVLLKKIQPLSPSHAKVLTCAMRMYLRFLASEDSVPGALVAAVPSVPRWSLSTLPRYISSDDVERAIACCGDHPAGVRDRAILLLLARLALRAGDIVALRLGDIDWDRAWIRVSGKSRREAVLPLPQDAGDALHAYIATVRPRVDEEKVFLCVLPPWRAFAGPGTVSALAKHALDRAGVKTSASRGAHVFRHSQATSLLRSGATLEVIQALLRHTSPNTTMIYAKTDAAMLLEVAQPWIGGIGS